MEVTDQKPADGTESKAAEETQLEKSGAALVDDELDQVAGGRERPNNKSECKYLM